MISTDTPQSPYELSRATIAAHSKSFALAATLLPARIRDAASVVYAWCRRADDAIDLAPAHEQARALVRLRAELDDVYFGRTVEDPVLTAFGQVVHRFRIRREYPEELLAGMEMDVSGTRYATWEELLRYAYRVAGTVGLMMSHVMGVSDDAALRSAAHLGMAMQITNICRDVAEDWLAGRLYLPHELLAQAGIGELVSQVPKADATQIPALPIAYRDELAKVTAELLERANAFYQSGDRGLPALLGRCALAIEAARLIYANIGSALAAKGYDTLSGRAVVPLWRKLVLVAQAAKQTVGRSLGGSQADATEVHVPSRLFSFEDALKEMPR